MTLVSHSQAGEIANHFAQDYPKMPSGAVLIDANLPQFFTDQEIPRLVAAPQPEVAVDLLTSIGALLRRVRQAPVEGGLTMPERAALSQLERTGPTTSSALARLEQITAQAMGATLGGLQSRGLVERSADPKDGRRILLALTDAGRQALADKRGARSEQIARVLADHFTPREREQLAAAAPLLDRLAQRI
ncbi:MarR family transcriptional regulator [Streptomyces sp. NBC_01264]|uniref:MarR family transcriptional regulator n=1 Tax=Streptomyces sp. NBC_01264 TaxID=2903804 RepID=UPI00225AAEFD|nr:MarR family transcriptional regulator [Streptomyces sp. NBC_01264]MCX4781977.1 MarR family transcriptional regulator [Streptomyces sp. NBC_01264]